MCIRDRFKALPDVPKAEIVWRFHFMLGATSYAIAGTDALRLVTDWQIEESDSVDRMDRLVPRLMSFLLGGLRSPLPQFSDTATSEAEAGRATSGANAGPTVDSK